MNEITITGNLVYAPTLRRYGTQCFTKFRLAHNHSYRDAATGDWTDNGTTFIDVSCWRSLAEHVCDSLGKGSAVIVTGRLRGKERTLEVEGAQEKRTFFEIEATTVGPDLTKGATQPHVVKGEAVQRQEEMAVADAMGMAAGLNQDSGDGSPFVTEHHPAA
jgi:single-strand DNA-binding protein